MSLDEFINDDRLKDLVVKYNLWVSSQLAKGGLIFTPEEWYNMKLWEEMDDSKRQRCKHL